MGANRSVERDPGKVNMMRSLFLEKILRDRQPERVLLTPEAIGCGLSLPSRRFYLTQCEFVDPEEGAGTDPAAHPLRVFIPHRGSSGRQHRISQRVVPDQAFKAGKRSRALQFQQIQARI